MTLKSGKCIEVGYTKKGKTSYKCFGCLNEIPAGTNSYYSKFTEEKTISKIRLCPQCAFYMTMKIKNTGDSSIKEGQFGGNRVANVLRKQWKEALTRVKAGQPVIDKEVKFVRPRNVKFIITKEEFKIHKEHDCSFMFLPVRHQRVAIETGMSITVYRGVGGEKLELFVKKVSILSRASAKKLKGRSIKMFMALVKKKDDSNEE